MNIEIYLFVKETAQGVTTAWGDTHKVRLLEQEALRQDTV
jgi:hypothetical protein